MALFEDAGQRLEWAGERLKDLDAAITAFTHGDLYTVRVESDEETGEYVLRVSARKPRRNLSLIVGEVVHHLRGVLDFIIHDVSELRLGRPLLPEEKTQFPIVDAPKDFKGQRRYLIGFRKDEVTLVKGLQPYAGHNWIARLRDMDNLDKHRRLYATPTRQHNQLRIFRIDGEPGSGSEVYTQLGATTTGGSGVVGRAGMGPNMRVDLQTAFEITLEDGAPVVPTLEILKAEVADILDLFKTRFS